jgi:hypothetical protein
MTPEYWKDLTPRQRLNDCIHKFAQANGTPYNTAWTIFEERYNERHGVNLSILRYKHTLTHGIKPTIPGHLEAIGKIGPAIDVALNMSMEG